ncbi:hypothetical protein OAE37_03165 [Pirellulaceae bacterium]|nr:hypothetical protein [Pirellulaceae bacterium]
MVAFSAGCKKALADAGLAKSQRRLEAISFVLIIAFCLTHMMHGGNQR